jgi:hypothetical protein
MKIRNGFVSNSSSSSFVLLKSTVSDGFIRKFSEWVDVHNNVANEGYIDESKSAFFGTKSYHDEVPEEIVEEFNTNVEWGNN